MRSPLTATLSLLFLILPATRAAACRMDPPPVTAADLKNPPHNAIAFQAVITKISAPDKSYLTQKPHQGFKLQLKVVKVFQGKSLGKSITVQYGPCHNLPGQKGELIAVLAMKDGKGNWYAPQSWQRGTN